VAPQFSLGTLTVTRPRRPFVLEPETPAPLAFGPITLLGYWLGGREVKTGGALDLTWYWRADAAPAVDYTARLELLGADRRPVIGWGLEPANGYGTGQWRPGDQWRGQQRVVIPADLPGGEYQLSASVDGVPGAQALGSLKVEAPSRTFERPAFEQAGGAQFEGVGELAGYSLERAGKTLTLTLIWKATAAPPQAYSVFVHLSSAAPEAGRVWTQSDSVPAGGARPTTGWLAGEYVTDAHTLTLPDDLPPGEYELYVGLYDPAAAVRVPASGPGAGADDRVRIMTLVLE
jgi:hypothetical protein